MLVLEWSGWTLPSLEQSCLALRDYDCGDLSTHLLEATQHTLDYINGRLRWARHLDHHWSCLHLWLGFERKRDILHDCRQGSWLLVAINRRMNLRLGEAWVSQKREKATFFIHEKGFHLSLLRFSECLEDKLSLFEAALNKGAPLLLMVLYCKLALALPFGFLGATSSKSWITRLCPSIST